MIIECPNLRDYGPVGDGVNDDSVTIQNAINAIPDGGTLEIPLPSVCYLVRDLVPKNGTILKGMTPPRSEAVGSLFRTDTRVFNITAGITSAVFKRLVFAGTSGHVGVAFGGSSEITSNGLDGVTIEQCTAYAMDYFIDSPAIYTNILRNQLRGTAMRISGGPAATNNINTIDHNIFQLDTGKPFALVLGIAAGGFQPQGGQAGANGITWNGFENNAGGAIELNGALVTTIEQNWFEDNNKTQAGGIVKCNPISGANNNVLFNRNRIQTTNIATTIIDHQYGPTHEFINNMGGSIGASLANFSNGTIFRAFGNANFSAGLMNGYPTSCSTGTLMLGGSNYIDGTGAVSVSGSPTTILAGNLGGGGAVNTAYKALVAGTLAGNPAVQFADEVLWFTNGAITVLGSTIRGGPAARAYSVSGANLQLQMSAGSYFVTTLHGSSGL